MPTYYFYIDDKFSISNKNILPLRSPTILYIPVFIPY